MPSCENDQELSMIRRHGRRESPLLGVLLLGRRSTRGRVMGHGLMMRCMPWQAPWMQLGMMMVAPLENRKMGTQVRDDCRLGCFVCSMGVLPT